MDNIFIVITTGLIVAVTLLDKFCTNAQDQGNPVGPTIDPKEVPECASGAFYSLESIMNVLKSNGSADTYAVQALLAAYNYNCRQTYFLPPLRQRRRPFIVVEGLQRFRRISIAQKLARYLKGIMYFNPPKPFKKYRGYFNDSAAHRRAYFSLTLYAAANNVKMILPHRAVVMAGYWLDQASFAMSRKYYPNLPLKDDPAWRWPKDLLMPDVLFFVEECVMNNATRKHDVYRDLVTEVYHRWVDPPPVFVREVAYRRMIQEMIPHVRRLFW